jgi:hypothetical protein
MSCRVFLVGEGPSDIGDLFDVASYRNEEEGFLQPLLRRMVGSAIELEFFDGRRLTALPRLPARADHGLTSGLQARKAAQALALAAQLGADALVFSCDLDKTGGQRVTTAERRRRLRELRTSIEEGFARARLIDGNVERVLTAIAIPARMIEAWALGDRHALARVLDVERHTLRYPAPEELWGDEADRGSHHPKRVWEKVTGERVTFCDVAEQADPAVLQAECPDSFAPFANDVARQIERCTTARGRTATGKRPRR